MMIMIQMRIRLVRLLKMISLTDSDRNRVVQTPSGPVTIEPGSSGPNSVEVTVPDGRTFENSCEGDSASIVINDFEVDVCE